ncbi:hypothetical protein J45TS6_11790 [Paenibacillus sp. J45TS6]|nr:hypothetical protein J45TS6_11790 [Paenibacillus sp. J45TS6]
MTNFFDLLTAVKGKGTIAAQQRNILDGTVALTAHLDTADLPPIINTNMENKDMVIIRVENTVQAKNHTPSVLEGFFYVEIIAVNAVFSSSEQ